MKKFIFIFIVLSISVQIFSQSVAGVKYGSSYETAKEILRNRFGDAYYDYNSIYYYNGIYFGGVMFERGLFKFERSLDGRSFFNGAILIYRERDTFDEVFEDCIYLWRKIGDIMSKKYKIFDEFYSIRDHFQEFKEFMQERKTDICDCYTGYYSSFDEEPVWSISCRKYENGKYECVLHYFTKSFMKGNDDF